jgi:hypothetical protein
MSLDERCEDTDSYNAPFRKLNERALPKGLRFDIYLGKGEDKHEIFALYEVATGRCCVAAATLQKLHEYIDKLEELGIEKIEDLFNIDFFTKHCETMNRCVCN